MEAGKCKKCDKICFPPRLICHDCHAREFETVQLDKQGKVVTFTVIRIAPSQFADQAPYALGIIEVNLRHLDIKLVKESLHEREVLLRLAPHLVQPVP